MSTSSNTTNEIRNVVSDAIPDPPRFSSNANINITDKNADSNDPQDDQLSENKIPRASSNNSGAATDADTKNSTTSNTDTRDNNAKHTYKPKKSSKSKKPTSATISLNIINSANVKVGPKVKNVYNFNNIQHHNSTSNHKCDTDSEAAGYKRNMSPHVEALSDSKLEITKEDMLLVKIHMGHGWKQVAKQIGYSKGQIEQFLENYQHSDEVIYQILLDWKQSCTKNATIGRLISEMWSSKEYECAEILAAAHNST